MTDKPMPWYVKLVVGVGAWITAVVAMLLGGAIVLLLLKIESALALAVIGAAYLALGLWLLRQAGAGMFATQMGIATAAAFFVQTFVQQQLSAVETAMILLLEPVFATFFGYLLHGDRLTWLQIGGAVLMVSAVFAVEIYSQWRNGRTP